MAFALLKCFSFLPLRVMYALGDVLFLPFYHLFRYRRGIVRKNLTESFPEKTGAEIRLIERRFYRFFLDTMFETVKMASLSPERIARRMRFKNPETIAESLSRGGRVALYLGHYGNWEWVSSLPLHLPPGTRAAQVYRRLSNPRADRLLIRNRERLGAVCVEMREIARRIARFDIVGFIADQSPRRNNIRHYVSFLHHDIPVFTGAETLTKRCGLEAWYLDVRCLERGVYEAEFVRLHDDPRALADFELTELYYRRLEQTILRRPECYLWSHNRFRHARRD